MTQYQAHRFAVAPMMDWAETFDGVIVLLTTVCKICTGRSPFLLLSFAPGNCTAASRGAAPVGAFGNEKGRPGEGRPGKEGAKGLTAPLRYKPSARS
jgi:hypothetical protein